MKRFFVLFLLAAIAATLLIVFAPADPHSQMSEAPLAYQLLVLVFAILLWPGYRAARQLQTSSGSPSANYMYERVKPLWRMLIAGFLAQIVGAIGAVSLNLSNIMIVSLWCGGAYATPIGLLLGIAWQYRFSPQSISDGKGFVAVAAVASIALPIGTYFLTRMI